jgi:hypothetical protein
MNTTIIYYTANMEDEVFEKKIRDNIKKQAGDMPIISVSRKPIDFGRNICVGETPVCYFNSFRQLLVGLKEAKTEFCIAAESDCLYPPEYFNFTPPHNDRAYRYTNLYVHFSGRRSFWKKKYVEAAQMCGREFWMKQIDRVIAGNYMWDDVSNARTPLIFESEDKYSWTGDNPVLYFKTRRGIGFKTGFIGGAVSEIPYWGNYDDVYNKYLK